MTPNDAQIDLLLKQHAQRARRNRVSEHLDADELNAFAEGIISATTRARFVSHLANCDDCRILATQLVIASGTGSTIAGAQNSTREATSWSKRLMAIFAPARLRYAAFAVVLLMVAAVSFVALRNQGLRRASEETARPAQTEVAQVKQSQQARPELDMNDKAVAKTPPAAPEPTQTLSAAAKRDESVVAQKTQPVLAKPATEAAANNRQITPNKAAETRAAETVPSFAPPPPGETTRAQNLSRDQQNAAGGAGRKDELANTNFGALDRSRSGAFRTNRNNTEENQRAANDQPKASAAQAADDKSLSKTKETESLPVAGRSMNELRVETSTTSREAAKKVPAPAKNSSEDIPETRSANGRKFRRQGNVWVDKKFKSSMSIRSISRGSDEYRALDSGIRSIAEQLGGDVIIVWKGKAYQIH